MLKRYKLWEQIGVGWYFFLPVVYFITMEKSASLWDNPEFITTFHKLEIGHPGTIYMLVYNVFSHFFPQHGDWVAIATNSLMDIQRADRDLPLFRTIAYLIQ